ncbi:GNAT family N-acetyltransferase [Flammeovirga sp. SubArs3]|uniref:GNAT family N-acetyltransferase n=1 Tax=Flammeovirga sp. SubArs3 TaxID=2995316 RepID=UPI00248D33DB|nr:GNAT family N-acetyltransferase [Flammeovirga sp. SubArs3]
MNTTTNLTYEPLTKDHLEEVKIIYDYYVKNSTATFHMDEVLIEELEAFIPIGSKKYPSYLVKEGTTVVGYAYLGPFKSREAYNRTAEVTIYLDHKASGRGIASKVIKKLEMDALEGDMICVLMAVITGDNLASIRLFEKLGYEKCAHLKQVGEKFGKILDVVDYQKIIR